MEFNYFHVKVIPGQNSNGSLFSLAAHDELLLGCHTRLTGCSKAAIFISEELANEFLTATLPTLCKRHGEDTEASVIKISFTDWSENEPRVVNLYQQASEDSEIVKMRIKANDFRPNAFGSDGQLKPRKRKGKPVSL